MSSKPKKITELAVEIASGLITAAGIAQAVSTTDITRAIDSLPNGHDYPQSQLQKLVESEIRKRRTTKTSGSK